VPELPEVDFARRSLEAWMVGQAIERVEADPSPIVRGSRPEDFQGLEGRVVLGVLRRGKQLFLRLDAGAGVWAHLGMSGKFERRLPGEEPPRWSRVRFFLAGGAVVHYRDPRMLGRLRPEASADVASDRRWRKLGPDAWDDKPTAKLLAERIGKRRKAVKEVLMDQAVLAGLGNIYVTEALWQARIRPTRRADRLSSADLAALAKSIRGSLSRALRRERGESITYVEEDRARNPFAIYGRAGQPCPRCKAVLQKTTLGGRTSAYCPTCQR
jgi:formamidopyrimidine-DNA glycosylase